MKKIIDLYQIGEKIEFYDTREITKGKRSEGKLTLQAGKKGPPLHSHPSSEEGFEVLRGTLILVVDGKEMTLKQGEMAIVKRGQTHTFRNESMIEPIEAKIWFEPAVHVEWMLQSFGEDAMANGGDWKNVSLLPAMYVLYKMRNEHRIAGIPFWLQEILLGFGAAIARISGASRKFELPKELI